MASDGSQEVSFKGQAFPFLPRWHSATPHHQQGEPQHHAGQQQSKPSAATGTWNGPAPRGYAHMAAQSEPKPAPVQEPEAVRLSNGQLMPILAFGTFNLQKPGLVRKALDKGFRHIDCAFYYFNEAMVGKEINEWIAASPNNRREDLYIVSKVFPDSLRPELLRKSFEKTLSDLNCGYLDCYLIHWPNAWVPGAKNDFKGEVTLDTELPREATWRAMEQLVDEGACRSIGLSNFSIKEVEEVMSIARIKPVCNQVELHPFLPQRKLVGACMRMGVLPTAYSPLGGPDRLFKPNDLITNPTVAKIAAEAKKTPAQVLLKWCMMRGIPALVKTERPERVEENFVGFDWRLTYEQKVVLDGLECGKRFIEPPWKKWDEDNKASAAKPSQVLGYAA